MSVKIRLSRIGKIHAPVYRIVAIDSRKKRDGEALDILGTYNPITGQLIQFHQDRVEQWVSKGAIISDAVKKIQKMHKKNTQVAA
jgi:small subunit ribosomal protein S16